MEHVAPDGMCDSSLKWSGRLSHRARRSWSVTFSPILRHLWRVLLIFNPLKNTCSLIIDFFGLLSKYMVWIKTMGCERQTPSAQQKIFSWKKCRTQGTVLNAPPESPSKKKSNSFSSSPAEATQLFLVWSYFMGRWNPCSLLVLILPHKSALFSIIFSQGSKALLIAHNREFVWGWRRRNTLNLKSRSSVFPCKTFRSLTNASFLNLGCLQAMNLEKDFLRLMLYLTAWLFWPVCSQDTQ